VLFVSTLAIYTFTQQCKRHVQKGLTYIFCRHTNYYGNFGDRTVTSVTSLRKQHSRRASTIRQRDAKMTRKQNYNKLRKNVTDKIYW